jgi:anti-sigma B factor antagonist
MTVVPRTAGTAVLICDRCGMQDHAAAATRDNDVVWPLVAGVGWTGSPFATGPHGCPQCGDVVPEPAVAAQEPPSPAPGASYGIQVHQDMDAIVVTPLVDIDADFAATLRDGLTAAVSTGRHVVLDLHAVQLIDSAGLGLLVRAHQQAKRRGGSLCLVAPSRYVLTVLHTMRLDTVFAAYPDEEAAFRALRLAAGRASAHGAE